MQEQETIGDEEEVKEVVGSEKPSTYNLGNIEYRLGFL